MSKGNALKQLINEIQIKTNLNLEDIGARAGYKGNYLSQAAGSDKPSKKIIDKLKFVFAVELASDSVLNDGSAKYKKTKENEEGLTMQALLNLTESNKILVRAHDTIANSNADLVTMVKDKTATDGYLPDTSLEMRGVILAMREFLAQLGAKVHKTSVEEQDDFLDKMTKAAMQSLEQKDNVAADGKQDKR